MPKDCKSCEAPVDDNADHASAGDCRAAQRRLIRELRRDVEQLKGQLRENEQKARPVVVYGVI